jgi:hypothetical protein
MAHPQTELRQPTGWRALYSPCRDLSLAEPEHLYIGFTIAGTTGPKVRKPKSLT